MPSTSSHFFNLKNLPKKNPMRLYAGAVCAAIACITTSFAAPAHANPKHILFLMIDDLGTFEHAELYLCVSCLEMCVPFRDCVLL